MEKMNQVSVSEFFAKSKEEMYDMAVEMVEKYNRLIDRHAVYTDALNKDLADKAAKIELLEKEIEGRKEGYWALKEKYDKLEKELDDKNVKIERQRENLDALNKTLEIRNKENDSLVKTIQTTRREIEAHESENARLTDKIKELRECRERAERRYSSECKLAEEKYNEAENLEEENARLTERIKSLRTELANERNAHLLTRDREEVYKQKVLELKEELNNYKSWNASLHKDIKELKKKKEDDHGKSGFKRYIEHLIEEEERAVPERFKERLNKEITEIFTKEEETEIKGNGRTSSGRYPWGAKVNDIPCGEDAIE